MATILAQDSQLLEKSLHSEILQLLDPNVKAIDPGQGSPSPTREVAIPGQGTTAAPGDVTEGGFETIVYGSHIVTVELVYGRSLHFMVGSDKTRQFSQHGPALFSEAIAVDSYPAIPVFYLILTDGIDHFQQVRMESGLSAQ